MTFEMILWECPSCRHRAKVAPGIQILCGKCGVNHPSTASPPPPLTTRLTNYAKALSRWTRAGRPIRTDIEVVKLREICQSCCWFDGVVCTHKKCGCSVVRSSAWGDKLKWATESCPIGKW